MNVFTSKKRSIVVFFFVDHKLSCVAFWPIRTNVNDFKRNQLQTNVSGRENGAKVLANDTEFKATCLDQ